MQATTTTSRSGSNNMTPSSRATQVSAVQSRARVEETTRVAALVAVLSLIIASIAPAAHAASYLQQQQQQQQVSQQQQQYQQQQQPVVMDQLAASGAPPVITPFTFIQNVQENQRASVLCTISSGDLPANISWLKDGQLLTPALAHAKKIVIKPDSDQSTLKFASVRLEHAANYTCLARNRAGGAAHSAQLVVLGEPRWLRAEPQQELLVATRGQTVVIDCQTTGWPRPQQSWLIKTHQHSEFEPLTGSSGRISLAPNGSLVIRNTDKSDEANYLCKSSNGIGKGISWSTSLKVNVPAHFESNKQQSNVVRRLSAVQLRCDAYGDEPITIEWFKNKQRVTSELDSRYSIHNKPLANGLISLLVIKQTQRQDNSIYECHTRNHVGKDTLRIELLVQEEPDNIQELQATQINSRSIALMWGEPYDGRSAITNYMLQYKRVQQEPAAQLSSSAGALADFGDLISVVDSQQLQVASVAADDWQQALRINVPASQANGSGLISYTIDRLEPSAKYVLRALAINAIGHSKFSQPMEFTTQEEAPEVAPTSIRAQAINSTSVLVSWDEIPKSKQLGRIHGYYIGYRLAAPPSTSAHQHQYPSHLNMSQSFVYKPYIINDLASQQQQQVQLSGEPQRLEFTIHELRRDTAYEITVMAFNSRGSGPSSSLVVCRTVEMEAPKAVKLQIRRESNESIFIEWQRDPSDQNPVDDYVLYQEKNSASQEWLQVRLPGNQSQYKAPGLKCGTRYQFYIIATNKVGKSPPSEVVGASTSGALPAVPSKTSLIKMVNSTCLLVNLNAFQDNACRIRTFTVRYRAERSIAPNGSALINSANGLAAAHQALSMAGNSPLAPAPSKASLPGASGAPTTAANSADWITLPLKSTNSRHQRASSEEDRMEYLCDLSPVGEYTIHVHAVNDVGRSEIEYTVLMSSDELRHSYLRDLVDYLSSLPNLFAYIPSVLVFLLAGLFLALTSLVLYTTAIKYYQKFVIMHNQVRATRRAKRDERRRRKLNNARHSQKLDLWAAEYEDAEDDDDGDDEEDDDDDVGDDGTGAGTGDECSSASGSAAMHRRFAANGSHYLSNIASSAFDTSSSSMDSPCKFSGRGPGSSCMSTASTDSMHGRFRCLNSKQYVKMNEYTMLPSISASLSPPNDIYGVASANQSAAAAAASQQAANNSLYYSTLRRSNMQTYLPRPRQQQAAANGSPSQQARHRASAANQNTADIYGYYMAPPPPQATNAANNPSQQAAQQAAQEAANSIFVPPQQIIYSAPNIRRQPVFL